SRHHHERALGTIERPLSPSLPRDCGHECRVCKVTVGSLTDYASHISSPTHKQNVEAAEQKSAGNDHEEDYFDQALADLIVKRKEQIRKEEFQQRLKEAKERYRLDSSWQQQPQGFGRPSQNCSWHRGNRYNARSWEQQPWHGNNQGKSATWHAQEPPNYQRWASDEFAGGGFNGQKGWNRRQWDQGGFCGNQQNRLPWLSSGGSSHGLYGHNTISQYPQRGRPLSLVGSISSYPHPPPFFSRAPNQLQPRANDQRGQQSGGLQNEGGQTAESDHNGSKSSKTFGSNPKLDKACRWSPYPVTKSFESLSHKDNNPNSSEMQPCLPKPQNQDKAAETSAFNKMSQPIQKQDQLASNQEKKKHKTSLKTKKPRDESSSSSSSSRSSSAQREGQQKSTSSSSSQKPSKPLLHSDGPALNTGAQLSQASNQAHPQMKPNIKQSGLGSKASSTGPLKSKQEQPLQETLCKVAQVILEKRSSLDRMAERERHNMEEQQRDGAQSQVGVNKENSFRQNAAKPNLPDLVRPASLTSDSNHFLQSLQVSTSTVEGTEPAASSKDEEENSGEAQTVSGSNTSMSKLDLPPVLKRDLTKHISSKSKTGSHEPNLNIARRVRNLSESRRSDSEKDSGLKPTVRQLISSSGSRRNVNWEQVYQEVRKKQDKGKGMPRFGIEMVPNEQEDHSQEEDDIPLLEGLHWEALIDISAQGTSRKRSLSESNLTPASTPSLFSSLLSKEAGEKERESSEQQLSPVSPTVTHGSTDDQKGLENLLGQIEAKTENQPDKLTSASVKALHRLDSVLGDSSSGTDQLDGQGTGKRRRAAGDVPSAETSCVEHNSKRRRVKSKKERLQIDQLLAVSLREEELSRSLQTVDTSLIQARAALEAAYLEVQRLMVVKQQVTVEMSTLRSKRIDLLKGMQGENIYTTEKSVQTKTNCLAPFPDSKSPIKLLLSSRRGSEVAGIVDSAATKTFEPPAVPSLLNLPASPSELSGGKRVRKLKKRKALKKAQGTEQPESSDTEIDAEFLKPRWLRPRRRPSGGSQVSTSTQPTEDREVNHSSSKDVALPQEAPTQLIDNVDVEESMEVAAASQQPHMDVLAPAATPVQIPDSSRPETESLACNEVTSTSDMEISLQTIIKIKSIYSEDVFLLLLFLLICEFSCVFVCFSDASSDHGEDDIPTEGVFEGHQEAVHAVQIHNGLLYTCSGDRTVKAFELVSHKCAAVFEGHSSKVSCLLVSATPGLHHRLYTGSSDQTIRCYSLKTKEFEQQFSLSDRVLCLHSRWRTLYAGLANGTVVTFNLKTNRQMDVFECHGPRAISCLASSQEGARRILLVGSYDNTISVRDAKNGLLLRTLEGHTKSVLCMKVVNDLLFSGSSDQCVHAHNIHTGELVRVYKGHSHAVTVVSILGKVMVTACLDKLVRVYDLQSHEQLQVYGGHKDMVMCMAVHKNMIYTGCYDGSVQAIKLNLMQNYRCWWHGCSLVFGVAEHLQQHLNDSHTGANLPIFRCRWKNCEEFFGVANRSKQGMLSHMQKHAAEETELEP
uniref:C2H2-type domain-containing protein n=1 Tax=Echeneis naucrates TaxID=173247 RepID=A0A665WJD1_ECHNA